jgi:hypothetical protein
LTQWLELKKSRCQAGRYKNDIEVKMVHGRLPDSARRDEVHRQADPSPCGENVAIRSNRFRDNNRPFRTGPRSVGPLEQGDRGSNVREFLHIVSACGAPPSYFLFGIPHEPNQNAFPSMVEGTA